MTLASGDALERAANVVRSARVACGSDQDGPAFERWVGAWEVFCEIAPNPCGKCFTGQAEHFVRGVPGVEPGVAHAHLCRECEVERRESLGLCTHDMHINEEPEPCSAAHRCDGCVESFALCPVCRVAEGLGDVGEDPCASCAAAGAENAFEAAREQGAA